jgi:hypothetical protein
MCLEKTIFARGKNFPYSHTEIYVSEFSSFVAIWIYVHIFYTPSNSKLAYTREVDPSQTFL